MLVINGLGLQMAFLWLHSGKNRLRYILPVVPWNHFNGQTWPELKMGPVDLYLSYSVWILINSTAVIN